MRLVAEVVDHSQRIKDLIARKLRASLGAAAERLSDQYAAELQRVRAPPHSEKGQVPHAYLGHRPGGFGPVNGPGEINNTVQQGFSRDQSDFLASYIHGVSGGEGQSLRGMVGFEDSHVTSRAQNYLLVHNFRGRPWVFPVYQRGKSQMIEDFTSAFRSTD